MRPRGPACFTLCSCVAQLLAPIPSSPAAPSQKCCPPCAPPPALRAPRPRGPRPRAGRRWWCAPMRSRARAGRRAARPSARTATVRKLRGGDRSGLCVESSSFIQLPARRHDREERQLRAAGRRHHQGARLGRGRFPSRGCPRPVAAAPTGLVGQLVPPAAAPWQPAAPSLLAGPRTACALLRGRPAGCSLRNRRPACRVLARAARSFTEALLIRRRAWPTR